jgi:hypothetical protein
MNRQGTMSCQWIPQPPDPCFSHVGGDVAQRRHSSYALNLLSRQASPQNHDLEPVPIGSIGVKIVSELSVQNDPKILQAAGNELFDAGVIRSFVTGGNCAPQCNKEKHRERRQEEEDKRTLQSSQSPSVVGSNIEVPAHHTRIQGTMRKRKLHELDRELENPREHFFSGAAHDKRKKMHIRCGLLPDGPTSAPLSSDATSREPSTSQHDEERDMIWSDHHSPLVNPHVPVPTCCTSKNNKEGETGDASGAALVLLATTRKNTEMKNTCKTNCLSSNRPRQTQTSKWHNRFHQLSEFKATYGHCCVPNSISLSNPAFVQWVKRQRHQYKLKTEGQPSTLSDRRQQSLNEIGFVWDSHSSAWMERYNQLIEYRQEYGHCNVPTNWEHNRQLSVWVKSQRRQYKLYATGSRSTITAERVAMINSLNFDWNPRRLM